MINRKYKTIFYCPDCKIEVGKEDLVSRGNFFKNKCHIKIWHKSRDYEGYSVLCGPVQVRHDQELTDIQFESVGELLS